MFGEESVPKIFKGERLHVTVDSKKANIDLINMVISYFKDYDSIDSTFYPKFVGFCVGSNLAMNGFQSMSGYTFSDLSFGLFAGSIMSR